MADPLTAARGHEEGPDATPRLRVSDKALIAELKAIWQAMSDEEKTTMTMQRVAELKERQENRARGVHNVRLASCQDAVTTTKHVVQQVSARAAAGRHSHSDC